MGLVLHRGAPGGAADRAAVGAWRQAGGLLVARDRDAARRLELAELAAAAVLLDRRVVTLGGLRSQVRRAAGMRAAEPPAELALRLALVEALAARITWPGFGESAEGPGFPAVAARAILELRSGRVAPPELAAAGRGDAVIADLAELARALPHGLAHADLAWEAADAAGRLSAFPPVAVVGFDDLAPPDWAMLRALGRVTDVAVALAYRPGRAAYRARDERQARWAAEASAVHDHEPADDGRPGALQALEGGLFEDVAPAGEAGDVVRFVEAAGTAGMYRAALEAALAGDADASVRRNAAWALGRIGDRASQPALEAAMNDRSPLVGGVARAALAALH